MEKKLLQWHPALQAVLQIDLAEDKDCLQYQKEFNLAGKPLQIDTLVIKLEAGRKVGKSIGHLFRGHNIIEYKSPGDYLSINDFYKVTGYACIYQANTEHELDISPEDMTITLAANRYPKKLVRHLEACYHVSVWNYQPGIYYVEGLMFPVQILVTGQLCDKEYIWLSRLRGGLTINRDIEPLAAAYRGKETDPLYETAMDLIIRANWLTYKEGRDMCSALEELFADKLEERERQGIERGIDTGKAQAILDLLAEAGTVPDSLKEQILSLTDPGTLSAWLKLAARAETIEWFMGQTGLTDR